MGKEEGERTPDLLMSELAAVVPVAEFPWHDMDMDVFDRLSRLPSILFNNKDIKSKKTFIMIDGERGK